MSFRSMTIVGGLMLALVATSILPAPMAEARHWKRRDIVDTLLYINSRTGEFDTLLAAVQTAGLVDALRGGPFTLFAPTDAAFSKIPDETIEFLLSEEGRNALVDILTYHVTEGRISYRAWYRGDKTLQMLNGDMTQLGRQRFCLTINDSKIVYWVIPASNGLIYVIDTVLLPPTDS